MYHASEELGHLSTAQKGDQQATTVPVAITSTNDRETTLHVPAGAGLRAAQAAYQEAKAASGDSKSAYLSAGRSGGAAGEAGTAPSRWSAVNAYRQAREAAERAAEGTPVLGESRLHIMAGAQLPICCRKAVHECHNDVDAWLHCRRQQWIRHAGSALAPWLYLTSLDC